MYTYQHFKLPSYKKFFGLAFIFSLLIAVFFQKIALPMVPDMHAGLGLLKNDAIVFHNAAIELSKRIQTEGWSAWSLYAMGFSGNVTILSIVYTIFGHQPVFFLPITALLHALSATLIYRLGFKLTTNEAGRLAGLIAGICFVTFPSSLQWYAQNHKDSFAIAGTLLLLETWLVIISSKDGHIQGKTLVFYLLASIVGVALIGIVRPHLVFLVGLGFLSSFVIVTLISFYAKSFALLNALKTSTFVGAILAIGVSFSHVGTSDLIFKDQFSKGFNWNSTSYLPHNFDENIRRLAELRVHFANFNLSVAATSDIDSHRLPNSAIEVINYLPRALNIALFSPFPNSWDDKVTATRLVGAIETCIWYFFIAGVLITLKKYANTRVFACIAFCLPIMTILAFVNPNIGTLYRERYGFWQILLLIGAIGWSTLLIHFLNRSGTSYLRANNSDSQNKFAFPVSKLMSAGFIVILITTCCYLGFFARDLIIINEIGLNHRLDAFFTAMMIPMFFVTCLAMPIGDLVTKLFITENTHVRKQNLIDAIISWSFLWLLAVTILIIMLAPNLVGFILERNETNIEEAVALMRLLSPILLLSAWTMTGNAVLNSLNEQKDAALGQLITPTIVISIILLSNPSTLLQMSVLGMLVGMILNVLWVIKHLHFKGFKLMPKLIGFEVINPLIENYGKLILSAVFPALLIPINYAFAASVGEGSLSAWAFSSKIVLLFTGIATVVSTSVFLPYFSQTHHTNSQHSFKIPLIVSVIAGTFLTLVCFIFVEPIVAVTVGKNSNETKVHELITIIQIGLLQIPVMIGLAVFNKHAIAGNRAHSLLIASLITFSTNILGNLLLVPRVGTTGVAISALAGVMAGFLFFYTNLVIPKRSIEK